MNLFLQAIIQGAGIALGILFVATIFLSTMFLIELFHNHKDL